VSDQESMKRLKRLMTIMDSMNDKELDDPDATYVTSYFYSPTFPASVANCKQDNFSCFFSGKLYTFLHFKVSVICYINRAACTGNVIKKQLIVKDMYRYTGTVLPHIHFNTFLSGHSCPFHYQQF
jgi:hypothetical protein